MNRVTIASLLSVTEPVIGSEGGDADTEARKPSEPIPRSLSGCLTCRRRKVKCDESKPTCLRCARASKECAGYETRIRFQHYDPDSDSKVLLGSVADGGYGRRQLYNVSQRIAMSRQMTSLVNVDMVEKILDLLDIALIDDLHPAAVAGPFMVFRLEDDRNQTQDFIGEGTLPLDPSEGFQAATDIEELPTSAEGSVTRSSPALDALDTANADEIDITYTADIDIFAQDNPLPIPMSPVLYDVNSTNNDFGLMTPSPLDLHLQPCFIENFRATVSNHAHFLLDHYKSQMIKLFSPLRAKKPPWSILHFPRALSALAEISVFQKTKHAHASLFYSILAVSAYNWDNIYGLSDGNTTYWRAIADNFQEGARSELQKACETELAGERSSKYKDILMAILTMVTISVVTGQHDEARSYLLNAETFIGLRGVTKHKKSKKVRLLHSIYLFLRIIEESTYIYPVQRLVMHETTLLSGQVMQFPSLRTYSKYQGRDLDATVGVDFETGLLGHPDDQDRQLFQDIYGIPQTLLSLISRATFLSNEIIASRERFPGFSMTSELDSLCNSLEREICTWKHISTNINIETMNEESASTFANQIIMAHLIAAFHSAAIVFFYRRVRNVHPSMLQHLVADTITNLEAFHFEQQRFSILNCGIVWPGFIAGAEAMDIGLQERFEKHLRGFADLSGMRNYATSANFLHALWKVRRDTGDDSFTWMSLMQDRQLPLVLT